MLSLRDVTHISLNLPHSMPSNASLTHPDITLILDWQPMSPITMSKIRCLTLRRPQPLPMCKSHKSKADSTAFFPAQSNWSACIHSLCIFRFLSRSWPVLDSVDVTKWWGRSGRSVSGSRQPRYKPGLTKLKLRNCSPLKSQTHHWPNVIQVSSQLFAHQPVKQFDKIDQFCLYNISDVSTKWLIWYLESVLFRGLAPKTSSEMR